jgi:hypothetical protein
MTRTDVMASSRPQTGRAANVSRRPSGAWRRLSALPVILLLAIALVAPTSAIAATTTNKEGLSGYNQKPAEKSGTSPSKEATTPEKKEAAPATSSSAPAAEKAKATLPFTGFDLRWTLGMGLLLVGAGFSIVTVQRRHRRDGGH